MIENLGSHCQISAFGAHVEKKSCKEGMGQLNRKIKKLGGEERLAVIHTKINCQKNYVSPEHETLLFFYRKTSIICSSTSLLRLLSQIALLIRFKILTRKMRQRRWIWWAGDFP